jgi:hypothetical protein
LLHVVVMTPRISRCAVYSTGLSLSAQTGLHAIELLST